MSSHTEAVDGCQNWWIRGTGTGDAPWWQWSFSVEVDLWFSRFWIFCWTVRGLKRSTWGIIHTGRDSNSASVTTMVSTRSGSWIRDTMPFAILPCSQTRAPFALIGDEASTPVRFMFWNHEQRRPRLFLKNWIGPKLDRAVFNCCLYCAHGVVYGHLVFCPCHSISCWEEFSPDDASTLVKVACVLHNFLAKPNDKLLLAIEAKLHAELEEDCEEGKKRNSVDKCLHLGIDVHWLFCDTHAFFEVRIFFWYGTHCNEMKSICAVLLLLLMLLFWSESLTFYVCW